MKYLHISIFIVAILLLNSLFLHSQTVYYDASEFPLIGKISPDTETRYERLPAYLKDKVTRRSVWDLGKNTSGLAIRFNSNSTSISATWESLGDLSMNHMTDTGVKGLDLYAWENNKWQYVRSGRPDGKKTEQEIISSMTPKDREFMLFLPLYDGLVSLSIGVDSLSRISPPRMNIPVRENPIVVYGTSITQGGCANRPGMSYTNILTRYLNREFINLGFSGNGQLDYEIAEVMAKRDDVGLFILDFVPNVTDVMIKEKTKHFVDILRKEHPHTPILLVESITFSHSLFSTETAHEQSAKNSALLTEYKEMMEAGDENLYYLPTDNLMNSDGEGAVDGVHLTDLGFQHLADAILKVINAILP